MNCELEVPSNRLDRLVVERDCWASNGDRRLPRRAWYVPLFIAPQKHPLKTHHALL